MKKDISIIIPHYNSYNYLERLINSIPEEERIEIIVVDDGSTTGDFNEKKEIFIKLRKNLIILKNKCNKGAGGARNTGLKIAKGKWIIFADADDYFLEGAFDIFYKFLLKESDIIYFNCTSIFVDTGLKARRHIYFQKILLEYIHNSNFENMEELKYGYTVPWGKMIKKNLIEKYDIKFSEIQVLNDYFFSIKAAYYASEIWASDEVVYCITRSKGSLTTNTSKEYFEIKIKELLKGNDFLKSKGKKYQGLHSIGYLITSLNFGTLYFLKLLSKLIKEKVKIFPRNFIKDLLNGFYFEKILERINDRKYKE